MLRKRTISSDGATPFSFFSAVLRFHFSTCRSSALIFLRCVHPEKNKNCHLSKSIKKKQLHKQNMYVPKSDCAEHKKPTQRGHACQYAPGLVPVPQIRHPVCINPPAFKMVRNRIKSTLTYRTPIDRPFPGRPSKTYQSAC